MSPGILLTVTHWDYSSAFDWVGSRRGKETSELSVHGSSPVWIFLDLVLGQLFRGIRSE